MITAEILQTHYREYASLSDNWVSNMAITKSSIIRHVLKKLDFNTGKSLARVLVLGASDKRYLSIHESIFQSAINAETTVVSTLDIDTEHLGRPANSIEHNAIEHFPNAPFDLIFSHELMKFLAPEEQLQVIVNSRNALSNNGLAMHVIHSPSIDGTAELRDWQFRVNPEDLLFKLNDTKIVVQKITFDSDSQVEWLRPTTVLAIRNMTSPS